MPLDTLRAALLLAVTIVVVLAGTAPAQAAFGIAAFDGSVTRADGSAEDQAGAHPYEATTSFSLNKGVDDDGAQAPDGSLRNLAMKLPRGFVIDPSATPLCSPDQLQQYACPPATQVGTGIVPGGIGPGSIVDWQVAIYNVTPGPGQPALFGFKLLSVVVLLQPEVRPNGDFGLTARIKNASQGVPVYGSTVTLWGVPADRNGGGAERRVMLTNPTDCSTGPVRTTLDVESWDGQTDSAFFDSHLPTPDQDTLIGPSGCEKLAFEPSVSVQTTTTRIDAPAGLSFGLTLAQNDHPTGLATAHLRNVEITLPEGMTINPSAAGGLEACSDAQLALTTTDPTACPQGSKIGTASARTPLLEEPLEGSVYVREQKSGDPESGEMFRLALVLESEERGVRVKLDGSVRADADSGRLVARFDDNPQLPVSKLSVQLKGGDRAPLATPPTCGPAPATVALSSWAGHDVTLTDTLAFDCPGLGGFAPTLSAGALVPTGGAFSPFLVRIARADGQEYIDGLGLELPTGLLAKLRGVPLCPEANAAAGDCGSESRIGSATVGAGAGSAPFFLGGQPVYLAGSYKGAPYSLSVAVRALAGPFDLGTVIVRQALYVDPTDAHVSVVSDPLPTIVNGVPLRLRSINVDVDRPGFTVNPTSCAEKRIAAGFHSQQGSVSAAAVRFQVGDCQALALEPRLGIALTGRRQLTDGKHPGVRASLTMPARAANLDRVKVTLPLSLALDPDNADALCEFAAGSKVPPVCPTGSIVGTAKAITPILEQPLSGPVYFVKNVRKDPKSGREIRTLPKLVIPLEGNGIRLVLTGTSATSKDRLVTTFSNVPDASVTRFDLTIKGGSKGILVVNGKACKRSRATGLAFRGQNGKALARSVKLGAPCGKAAKKAERSARR